MVFLVLMHDLHYDWVQVLLQNCEAQIELQKLVVGYVAEKAVIKLYISSLLISALTPSLPASKLKPTLCTVYIEDPL